MPDRNPPALKADFKRWRLAVRSASRSEGFGLLASHSHYSIATSFSIAGTTYSPPSGKLACLPCREA